MLSYLLMKSSPLTPLPQEILSKLGEEVSAKEQAGCALKAALAEARKGYLKDSAVILNELRQVTA